MDASSSVHDIRIMRLERDEHRLAELESQITLVSRALEDINAKLQALECSRSEAQIWLSALTPQRDDILRSIKAQRAAISPLSTFPEELLGHIFRMGAFEPDNFWPTIEGGVGNFERAHSPFVFAAVSQHWRRAALHAPDIWHYIAVPPIGAPNDEQDSRLLGYVNLVLSRSGATALDIMLESIDEPTNPVVASMLEALNQHIGRWRNVFVAFYNSEHIVDTMHFLRGDASLLEQIALGIPTSHSKADDDESEETLEWPDDLPVYLFNCPKLRVCVMRGVPFAWGRDHPIVPSLVSLSLELATLPVADLWTTLELTPMLEALTICSGIKEEEVMPLNSLELKKLTTLRLLGNSPSLIERRHTAFKTPLLQSLTIESVQERDYTMPVVSEFLAQYSETLVELELREVVLDDDRIDMLRPLKNIRTLRLLDTSVPCALFDAMQDKTDCLMPQTSHLVLNNVDCTVGDEEGSCDGLLRLVRARNVAMRAPDMPQWSKLQQVVIVDGEFPKWDVIEIEGIMRNTTS